MSEKHVPSEETARGCFLDGAAGEFLPEDWAAFLARIRRTAWSEGAHTMTTGADNDWIDEQNPYRDPEETP